MVGFVPLGSAENAGSGRLLTVWLGGGFMRGLVLVTWGSIPNRSDPHVQGGEVEIKEGWI